MPPRLETDRLDLVPLTPADADEMATVLADPALYAFIGGQPPSAVELRERYQAWTVGPSTQGEAWHNWTIRLRPDGHAIGHLQATIIDHGQRADIAWVVGAPWQGLGYASEAARALVEWLEGNGVTTITAHVHPDHAASERVATGASLSPTDVLQDGERVWRRVANSGRV